MEKKYYCLIAGLPDILLGDKKVMYNSVLVRKELELELSEQHYKIIQALYLPFDHNNLIQLMFDQNKEFDLRGNFSKDELEKLTDKKELQDDFEFEDIPLYLVAFSKEIILSENRITAVEAEKIVYNKYIQYIHSFKNKFLSDFIIFSINQTNIFTALNGRKFKLDYHSELIGNNEVVEALTKSRARDFGLTVELDYIDTLINIFEEENLLERELKVDRLKWDYLEESIFFNYFTVERVLAFVYKLLMVERWIELDEEEGKNMFRKLINELESSYEFPEEYNLRHGKR